MSLAASTTTAASADSSVNVNNKMTESVLPQHLPRWKAWIVSQLDAWREQLLKQGGEGDSLFSFFTTSSTTEQLVVAVMGVAVMVVLIVGPLAIFRGLIHALLQLTGVMLGVGLGLGLATHVSELLTTLHQRHLRGEGGTGTFSSSPTSSSQSTYPYQQQQQLQQSLLYPQSSSSMLLGRQKSSALLSSLLEEPDSYASLMQSAGYNTTTLTSSSSSTSAEGVGATSSSSKTTILRGQVLRSDDAYFGTYYTFEQQPSQGESTTTSTLNAATLNKARNSFAELFPVLPENIRSVLALLVEYVMRDFVACWYYKIDSGCIYPVVTSNLITPAEKGDDEVKTDGGGEKSNKKKPSYPRRMVYTVGSHRRMPCLDKIYESTVIFMGGLATRVEHVNVFSLLLLQWTRIFAHTFKVYRALRQSLVHRMKLQQQQHTNTATTTNATTSATAASTSVTSSRRSSSAPTTPTSKQQPPSTDSGDNSNASAGDSSMRVPVVTEVSMTKEFLLAGKLHRAVTFGLDVPSVLFADASVKETGRPIEDVEVGKQAEKAAAQQRPASSSLALEDAILQERLDVLIGECELDYHRVLAHRMVRALLPRNDFACHIFSTLLVEILAGCALTPMMQCVSSPEYINSWVIMGLGSSKNESSGNNEGEPAAAGAKSSSISSSSGANNEATTTTAATPVVTSDTSMPVAAGVEGVSVVAAPPTIKQQDDYYPMRILEDDDHDECDASAGSCNSDDVITTPVKARTVMDSTKQLPLDTSLPSLASTTVATTSTTTMITTSTGDGILMLLGMALIELQRYVDLDDEPGRSLRNIDWDNAPCRAAVLKLVLVIEAAMMDGRCTYSKEDVTETEDEQTMEEESATCDNDDEESRERAVEVTLPEFESTTLSQILMEMTSDLEAFEQRVAEENATAVTRKRDRFNDMYAEDYCPTATEQSTLRTLIAAWLHTGQIYRIITVLVQAHTSVLAPYYRRQAFLRIPANANGFARKLKTLDGVEILVDTMAVLAAPRLHETSGEELAALVHKSTMRSLASPPSAAAAVTSPTAASTHSLKEESGVNASQSFVSFGMTSSTATPRYLDFNRNEAFASSLRSERERRMQSWETITREADRDGAPLPIICRSRGAGLAIHKEVHHLARIFYSSTNLVALRDAARRRSSSGSAGASISEASADVTIDSIPVCLLTVETASQRRRIEIPDDDSSFLLRAQPRPLNAVGVHRDQRNHDQSFKCFAATYEEPAVNASSEHGGGRYIRRCLVRYYPIDRTASVALQPSDGRRLDQRKNRVGPVPGTITVSQGTRAAPFLSNEFLRERHLCQRWIPKGTTRTQSILASSVMEPTDFNSMPRSGRAMDFVYRLSFFERPMIDLGGKHFTIQDSSSLGTHRADASSLEITDASMSAALLMLGANEPDKSEDATDASRNVIEMGQDGYPMIWMRFSRKDDDNGPAEVKPYRMSFIRAALLVTSARHEAQLQNLSACVRTGSAKKATKNRTESLLRPTVRLLEYSGSRSREKQTVLMRDLKLGVNHIDREQLRRNGLLSPRYPTLLRDLSVTVEDAFMAHEIQSVELFGATGTVFKIRCVATVEVDADDSDLEGDPGYTSEDGSICRIAEEEWVVYRTLKDFQAFHKHVKMQVSASESSGTAGSRLVGAAAAAFATANGIIPGRSRQRELLIPSLAQASKTGTLGVTKKSTERRKEALAVYLRHFLSPGHLLSRSAELLLFIGASFPLSQDLRPGCVLAGIGDPLGRTEMKRTILKTRSEITAEASEDVGEESDISVPPPTNRAVRSASCASVVSTGSQDDDLVEDGEGRENLRKSRRLVMIPSIGNKIEKIPLSQFRHRIFELVRYLFGFDNASFVRNRMLAALKTASFAVASNAEFQKMLYNAHTEHLSAESLSGWIKFAVDLLWPEGEFYTSSPPTPIEELEEQSRGAKAALHASFPEQLRAILGQELTKDGLDIFHEMLQNRVVMKSVVYMLFDLLWLEIFPEIGDVLEGGSVLDILDS